MIKLIAAFVAIALVGWLIVGEVRRRFFADLKSPERRAQLWERLYGWDWQDHSANNYGYAPSALDHPEKFQLELYRALFAMSDGLLAPGARMLEVSCGRGGGLAYLAQERGKAIVATGLDLSAHAINAAQRMHPDIPNLTFVRGSAIALPFDAETFDVVLNVEASHEYPDFDAFLAEVRRVLRPGGLLLHCNARTAAQSPGILESFEKAGFKGEIRDITAHVAEACRLDSARRAALLRRAVPRFERALIGRWLGNYAALEGSRKFEQFQSGSRGYFMSCLRMTDPA
ncbi:class I SAM-dependent methyltransferase [Porphyrobacter sp. LM 6]|uniref:class I SAM-dependent methyltransferase n=1 Tax=Porphyrobacter sp. LM 6 TaxID=1896196 RepID=UPI000846E3ED|nr:class I SAM-dependent methyltransferase [Porphyrobacter sp. LM 6]AOL94610.1 Methyltransferase domain-containing protein [Porphyrobacter sp. LM 6]